MGIDCPKILEFYMDGEHMENCKIKGMGKNILIQNLFVWTRVHFNSVQLNGLKHPLNGTVASCFV